MPTLAMNDRLAISISITGTLTTRTTFDNPALPQLPSQEVCNLRLALTGLITESLYAEPSVSWALNGPSHVTIGLNLPYTFTLPSFDNFFSSTP